MTDVLRTARRTHGFTESVIREMTRVARECGAINLAQGFPDFPAPALLKDAACGAVQRDENQYAITWGAQSLREAVADKSRAWYGMDVDSEREVTVTCGATEAMVAVMLSESALCLALQGAELQVEAGILTPASAMGMRLVERLRAAGMTFEIKG